MKLRRGQHLLNYIHFKLKREGFEPSLKNIENCIWNISDVEFYDIIKMDDIEAQEYYNKK